VYAIPSILEKNELLSKAGSMKQMTQ